MRCIDSVVLLLTLTVSVFATAQSSNPQSEDSTGERMARCAYVESDVTCKAFGSSREDGGDRERQVAQAQFPGPRPGFGPSRPMPGRCGRPAIYHSYDDGHHAVIGGLIGFGAGFAVGAGANHNSANRVGTGLVAGGLGAVFGAAIGHAIATFPHASYRHHRWSEDDEWAYARPAVHAGRKSPSAEN